MQLIRYHDLHATPWKNGGGVTRQIAAWPPAAGLDDFIWRISTADVAADGPFSHFDGIDRQLMLLEGAGAELAPPAGEPLRLAADQPLLAFPGEAPLYARLTAGPIRDLNLMVRRSRAEGRVGCLEAAAELALAADWTLLFCATGTASVWADGQATPLAPGDSLLFHDADANAVKVDWPMGAGRIWRLEVRLR